MRPYFKPIDKTLYARVKMFRETSSGNVLLLKNRKTDEKYIFKRFKPRVPDHIILREFKMLSDVNQTVDAHKHFPVLHDLYRTDNHRYIAYNYIPGIDGFDYNNLIYERAANTNLIKSYIKNILQLVQICHKQNIAHLDIKPENLIHRYLSVNQKHNNLPSQQHNLRLIDFGHARKFDPNKKITSASNHFGTPKYTPPESRDKKFNKTSDIYSVGSILAEHISWRSDVSKEVRSLCKNMRDPDPYTRPCVDKVLSHEWFNNNNFII